MKMKIVINIVLVFSALISCTYSYGQYSTESKTGTNAILLNNSSISLSISDPKLSFDWTSLPKYVETKNSNIFGSVGVNAKNKSGIGNLFSKGNLVSESDLHGVFGFYLSNAIPKSGDEIEQLCTNENNNISKKLLNSYSSIIDTYKGVLSADDIQSLKTKLNGNKNDLNHYIQDFETIYADLLKDANKAKIILGIKMEMKQSANTIFSHSKPRLDSLRNYYAEQRRQTLSTNYYRISIFAFGNINASAFKHFEKLDTSNYANSFKNIDARGGSIGIGVNAEWRIFRFGITYSYKSTDNFSMLNSTDYTLKSAYANQNQTLSSEYKLTAYSGKYGKVEINELNLDLIVNLSLNEEKNNYLLVNPYLHATKFSRDITLLSNLTSIGTGLYFFKKNSSFLGGLYIELPDVNNTLEKRKSEENQNLRPALNRLTFGIATKISFNSIRFW